MICEDMIMVIEILLTFGKALNAKLFPLLPKSCVLPIWAEAEKALSIFDHTFHIIPAQCESHQHQDSLGNIYHIQANLQIIVFPFIGCEDKRMYSTGLIQLSLKVLDDPLSHGRCHPR